MAGDRGDVVVLVLTLPDTVVLNEPVALVESTGLCRPRERAACSRVRRSRPGKQVAVDRVLERGDRHRCRPGELLRTVNVKVTGAPGSGTEVGSASFSIVMLDGLRVFVIVQVSGLAVVDLAVLAGGRVRGRVVRILVLRGE